MRQKKYVILGLIVTVLAVGGVAAWAVKFHKSEAISYGRVSQHVAAANITPEQNGQSISLNKTQTQATNPNALGVSSGSSASNLGQLGAKSSGSQGAASSGSGSSSSAPSGPSPIDPSTFGQYEKYKDGSSALFGDVQAGTGAELGMNQKAAVYYKGWLTNGSLFDQSRAGSDGKVQPFIFTEGAHQVITGWEQGLAGMKVGGTRLIIVPPSVGYGDTAQGSIPANSVLVFQVQLLEVQ